MPDWYSHTGETNIQSTVYQSSWSGEKDRFLKLKKSFVVLRSRDHDLLTWYLFRTFSQSAAPSFPLLWPLHWSPAGHSQSVLPPRRQRTTATSWQIPGTWSSHAKLLVVVAHTQQLCRNSIGRRHSSKKLNGSHRNPNFHGPVGTYLLSVFLCNKIHWKYTYMFYITGKLVENIEIKCLF